MWLCHALGVRLLDDRGRATGRHRAAAPSSIPAPRGPLKQRSLPCLYEPNQHDVLWGHHSGASSRVLQTA